MSAYSELFLKSLEKENSEEFVQERIRNYQNNIYPFFKNKGEVSRFFGQGTIPISCCFFRHPNPVAKILLATGYNESYLKYAELIQNLYDMRVSVYCYDHRGQGYSGRFLNQNKRGYVDFFPNLVDDLCTVFRMMGADNNTRIPCFLLGHSMGAAVIASALCSRKINPAAAILSAPMFEVMLTPWHVLEGAIFCLAKVASTLGFAKSYAFGQKNCTPFLPFDTNDVTHSKSRFFTWRKHISEIEEMQLGGPTFGWLNQAISASRKLRYRGSQIVIPTTILQAQDDTVVRNSAQDIFIGSNSMLKKVVCEHSRHEILMEVDSIRSQALNVIKRIVVP
ncbi:MAG: alpha/beta fold hydrolase [Bdellovibrionota bacterium]